uniref:type I protein arginine methyltransferase n=1 Tax=Dermatophagoides pteronyssinus TaxID=6956 RepID=A0A6P6YA09_DERPT|nr:protein arginine N-methyltransferase 1-like [Dermatophagoides pteronyssinus]
MSEFLRSDSILSNLYNPEHDYYYNSYSYLNVHEEMLKDHQRTLSYHNAIMNNKHLFENKIVLDVGAGTGILSMFAAKAGAKHVYAIEYSSIADIAQNIVATNKLSDRITIIKKKAEETELPVDKVDIIISEWMGYMLLFEGMLDTVIFCRNKWLRNGGLMFPEKAFLEMAAVNNSEWRLGNLMYWNNVYGFDFSPVKEHILNEAVVNSIDEERIISTPAHVAMFDLYTVQPEQLNFFSGFQLKTTRRDYCFGFVVWFDVYFPGHVPTILSTSPLDENTHWKQTILYFEEPLLVDKDNIIQGLIGLKKNRLNARNLDIKLHVKFKRVTLDKYFFLQ